MSTIVIRLDGTNITSKVVLADAFFTQQANGQPGSCQFRIRDLDHTFSPRAGQTVTLDVDGVRSWGGWAMRVSPGYFFSVDDTKDPTLTERAWTIEGVDYNILFSKRFLINKNNPVKYIPDYPKGTPDNEIVLDVVSKYLELGGDGISTAGVTHVGSPNPDDTGNIGNPGDSWGAAMNIISIPTQAVFYIDPNKVLQYVDVETESAPFALTDVPDHTTSFGYRDMEVTFDGTNLVNDSLVWGAAPHSTPDINFKRVEDATSIAEHGRWQRGEFSTALYTDSGVNHRARTFVYGSPQSKRGGKDDSVQVMCTVFKPGFTAGQIVSFTSSAFGYSDLLPIRRMMIRFPSPTKASFQLSLSYDIDAPWSDYESWFPRINFNPGGGVQPPVIHVPPIVVPPPGGDGCSDEVCGITDSFSRTIFQNQDTIGTSDAGIPWSVFDDGVGASVEVSPTEGLILTAPAGETFGTQMLLDLAPATPEFDMTYRVKFTDFVIGEGSRFDTDYFAFLRLIPGLSDPGQQTISVGLHTAHFQIVWQADVWYNVHLGTADGKTSLMFGIWPDGDEDNTTKFFAGLLTLGAGDPSPLNFLIRNQGSPGILRLQIDDLNVLDNNLCDSVQFDDFRRTTAEVGTIGASLGVALTGQEWLVALASGSATAQVDTGLYLFIPSHTFGGTAQFISAAVDQDGPWRTTTGWTMTTLFSPMGGNGLPGFQYTGFDVFDVTSVQPEVLLRVDSANNVVMCTGSANHNPGFDIDPSQQYYLKFQYIPGVNSSAKIWLLGTDEPTDWLFTDGAATVDAANVGIDLRAGNQSASASASATNANFTFIDFDYDGRPCFYDCSAADCGITDSFERTVAEVTHLSNSGTTTAPIGTSDSGVVWSGLNVGGGPYNLSNGGMGSSIDGSSLVLRGIWNSGSSLHGGGANYLLPVNIPQDYSTTKSFTFRLGSLPVNGSGFRIGIPGAASSANVYGNPSGAGGATSYIGFTTTLALSTAIPNLFWATGVTYTVTEHDNGTDTTISVMSEGLTYSYTRTGYTNATIFNPVLGIVWDTILPVSFNDSVSVFFDNLDIPEIHSSNCSGCLPVDPQAEPSARGSVCESTSGGSRTATVSQSYVANTTKVYIDGLYQQPGVDYVENPAAGSVLFATATPPGSIVTVCFYASLG